MADLTQIRPGVTVASPFADKFRGLFGDLEAAGYRIEHGQSGGYNPRVIAGTTTPSQHAHGRAVDINWTNNARGTTGDIPPDLARSLAAKHGLTWGGDWKNPDPMHFEIADAGPLPMSQRGLTAYAGAPPQPPPQSVPPPTTGGPQQQPQETTPMTERRSYGLFGEIGDAAANTMMSPLFLAGAGLLSGEGMSGAMAGMQAGSQFQQQRRKNMLEDQSMEGLRAGLNGSPALAGMSPAERQMLASNPTMAQHVLGTVYQHQFDPQAKLKTDLMQEQLNSERSMRPLKMEHTAAETSALSQNWAVDPNSGVMYNKKTGETRQPLDGGGQSKEFRAAAAKQVADIYGDHVKDGQKAVQADADLRRLEQLSSVVGSGKMAQWLPSAGPWLQTVGVNLNGLDEAQAFQAIVSRLAPNMRPTGSGSTSDRDMAIFMNSLPQLSQSPEGRKMVIDHMRGMGQFAQQRAQIASAVLTGKMTTQQGEDMIAKLGLPSFETKVGQGAGPQLPPQQTAKSMPAGEYEWTPQGIRPKQQPGQATAAPTTRRGWFGEQIPIGGN